jgi:hypothetical protein
MKFVKSKKHALLQLHACHNSAQVWLLNCAFMTAMQGLGAGKGDPQARVHQLMKAATEINIFSPGLTPI